MTATVPSSDTTTLQEDFRSAMAAVCTPVAVVTASDRGLPYGTTVSAFNSLSMTPPMVLVALDKNSELLSVVQRTGKFGMNVLGSAQSELALTFARKGGPAKFANVDWDDNNGVPHIPGTSGFLACSVAHIVEGGDHLVVLGEVLSAHQLESAPLTYHCRSFGTHVALEDA